MRIRRIIILILITFAFCNLYSQSLNIPSDYKIPKSIILNYSKDYTPAFIRSGLVVANPTKSKYISSNSSFDIFPVGDTVWFATGAGIMRTINHFQSFDHYYNVQPFGIDGIPGFAVKNNIVVVSTSTTVEISGDKVSTGTGIKVSTDYGVNWNSYPQPMDGRYDTTIIYGSNTLYALSVVVPQQNLSYDIAITRTKNNLSNYTIWISSFAGGLRKSDDYGVTWQRVLLPPDNLDSIYIGGTGYTFALNVNQNLNHRVFTVMAINDSTLFAGTANGINKSTDWGVSWRKYNFQNSGTGVNRVGGNFVVEFHLQQYGAKKIIWAATRKAEDVHEYNSITYSTDYGLTWAHTLRDFSPNGISSKDSVVYALTDAGLWRSYFGNFSWSKPSLIYDAETKDISNTNSYYVGGHIGDTLYFGCGDGLLRTIETGQPWVSSWKIYRALQEIDLSSDIQTYSAPNPFSPSQEYTRIFYKTGKASSKITIKIFDFGMNPVRTLIQNAIRTSPDELYTIWDGKNNDGYQVANGVYFYRLEVEGDANIWGKILVLQ